MAAPAPTPRDADRRSRAGGGVPPLGRRLGQAPSPVCPRAVARWACGEGLRAGDTVALLVRDLAQAEAMRLGLVRLDIHVACLDRSLRNAALADSLNRSCATLAIVDTALADAYAGMMGHLASHPAVWWNGAGADFCSLDRALAELA